MQDTQTTFSEKNHGTQNVFFFQAHWRGLILVRERYSKETGPLTHRVHAEVQFFLL